VLAIHSHGALVFRRTIVPRGERIPSEAGLEEREGPVSLDQIMQWFMVNLGRGRNLTLELGGHGDLRVRARLNIEGRQLSYEPERSERATDMELDYWTTISYPDEDDPLIVRLRAEILRAIGVRPA
jgi:hypothetical protein